MKTVSKKWLQKLANKLDLHLTRYEKAVFELRESNSKDGDWERVRRAIFILENEVRWVNEYSI